MNILDAQQMTQVQNTLISVELHPNYAFIPLDFTLIDSINHFTSPLFATSDHKIQEEIQKLVPKTHNTRYMKNDDPNSSLKLFTYALFELIFPASKGQNRQQKSYVNHLLLETLKCSLFSKDINFTQFYQRNHFIDNFQAKAMIAQFLHSAMSLSQLSNERIIRYIQWTFNKNHNLFDIFIRFFRIILFKLGVEDADKYQETLPFEETITNLIEYFDISYRNFGELFLISEQHYFLAKVKESLVIGEYYQNERKNSKEIKKAETNLSVPNQSQDNYEERGRRPSKKNGVIGEDVKLFNFILDSGKSSRIMHENINDIETPHFKDSHEFAFGRKKKDEDQLGRQEELKRQFEKLIMNSDSESVNEFDNDQQIGEVATPPTPQLGGSITIFTFESNLEQKKSEKQKINFLRKSTFNDSPIQQLEDENLDNAKINPQIRCKNIVSVKDKNFTTFSPQVSYLKDQYFGNINNDALFLEQDANIDCFKSSSGRIAQLTLPYLNGTCMCGEIRRKRNNIVSKVIEFINNPLFKNQNQTRSPRFIHNLKISQNIDYKIPKIKVTPPKEKDEDYSTHFREARTPNFLKFLKKDKEKIDKYSVSSKSKSKSIKDHSSNMNREKGVRFQLDRQTLSKINDKYSKYNTIISKNIHENRFKQPNSKSTTRKNESNSLSKRITTEQANPIKTFDTKNINSRPGLGNNWKSSSNFHQRGQVVQRRVKQHENMFDKKYETMKVYAPVHIIAPTVYFNGNYQKDNKVIFKVNEGYGQRDKVIQMKQSQKINKTEPIGSGQNEKGISYCNRKYI